jgi:hypothetical protein
MNRIESYLGALVISAVAGCTSWSRLPKGQPVPARGTIQVWSAGQDLLLREAKTLGDSLVGRRATPDTARSSVALENIDSLRVQTTDLGKTLIVGTGVAIALVFAVAEGLGSK